MKSAFSRVPPDRKLAAEAVVRAAAGAEGFDDEAVRLLIAIRRDFLDALPVAAAVIGRRQGGGDLVHGGNQLFERLCAVRFSEARDLLLGEIPLLASEGLAKEIDGFLRGADEERQFNWSERDPIGGRHFTVRLARLNSLSGYASRCLITLMDRTAEVETARSLRSEMLHDSLTGLPNRVAFGEAVDRLIEDGGDDDAPRFAVMVIDLRRFSRINQSLGGVAGDELIITAARRLISSLRPSDRLARIGGDEFAVLLGGAADIAEARAAAERLSATLRNPFRLSDVEIRIDAAIGCAFGTRSSGAEDLLRQALFAAKCAKASGRVEFYQADEARIAHRLFAVETDLRRAIDNDELTLAFQPVIDLASSRVAGFEALARWCHPGRGPIGPAEFIPVAEEAGLVVPLGRWALDAAARTLAGWDKAAGRPLPFTMAVNVSAVQIAADDVAAAVAETLARYDLTGDRLTLELTESVIIADPERATRALDALKQLDVRIAMDDFGTGYSSLAYLQRLPIDILKIDRRFVTGMLGDRDSVAIVRAVLSLADALGMKATAEGVETFELAQTLSALGCRFAQGYHFARPLSPEKAIAYALSRSA